MDNYVPENEIRALFSSLVLREEPGMWAKDFSRSRSIPGATRSDEPKAWKYSYIRNRNRCERFTEGKSPERFRLQGQC